MDTSLAYLISVAIIVFGIWTMVVAAPGSNVFVFWIVGGLLTVIVGLLSLLGEIRP
jgi:hypothetical protein